LILCLCSFLSSLYLPSLSSLFLISSLSCLSFCGNAARRSPSRLSPHSRTSSSTGFPHAVATKGGGLIWRSRSQQKERDVSQQQR
jgi:hypothetical protein